MSTHTVATIHELQDGRMKKVQAGEQELLLVHTGGEFYVHAASCPHHGAPLTEGLLRDGHIRCPWHMAVFDAETGRLEDPPSMESLPGYSVRIEGENVVVELPDDLPSSCRIAMAEKDTNADGRTFVILGAGAAGMNAAETLRQDGFQGHVILLTREDEAPYDRTDLSKPFLRRDEPSSPVLREREFYDRHGIELRTGCIVTKVDSAGRRLTCADGEELQYDKLLLAGGSVPKRLGCDGEDLDGVMTLRSFQDARCLRDRIRQSKHAVLVGASFISMEVAAGLAKHGGTVDVVAPESVPFETVLGEQIGRMYQKVHEEHDVTFHLGRTVERFQGDGSVEKVFLQDGTELPADLVVVGVGVRPATEYLGDQDTNDDGSVTVNSYLQASDSLFAAGDIACFADWRLGRPTRIEHWRVAQQQGRLAAHNMMGKNIEYRRTPFFWTNQYMVIVQYAGHAPEWDEILIDGAVDEQEFIACYCKDQAVQAVAACGKSKAFLAAMELLETVPLPTPEVVQRAIRQVSE